MPAVTMEQYPEIKALLEHIRKERGFNVEKWVKEKCIMLNNYMKKCGLKACVINMSGGIDSSCTFGLICHAMTLEGSPIEKLVGVTQPICSTASIQNRAYECKIFYENNDLLKQRVSIIEVDQTEVYKQLRGIISKATGIEGNYFADGNLRSYMRTPPAFYIAQLLCQIGFPAVTVGTGNLDEDGYLFYFSKAGDGISDIQLIHDLHKSEVKAVSSFIGVPRSILDAPPSADLWDGQTDEDEIGATYDFVELFVTLLHKGIYEDIIAGKEIDGMVLKDEKSIHLLKETCNKLSTIHRRNKHKEKYPYNLDILEDLLPK